MGRQQPCLAAEIDSSTAQFASGGTFRHASNHQTHPVAFCLARHEETYSAFVPSCPTCQQAKPERVKYPGLLQPLATPSAAWQVISLDFVEGLPISHGFNCILVVVDLFSKYSHFVALKHPFSALSVAKIFMQHIYRLHGLPTALVSDHDRIFTSQLWRELFHLAGVDLRLSSAYHPQSDGQTE